MGGRTGDLAERNHCSSQAELYIRFALWMRGQSAMPSRTQIQARFGCSYAHAYRMRSAWCAATGQPKPSIQRDQDYPRPTSPAATGTTQERDLK